jgi:hypothetical protein
VAHPREWRNIEQGGFRLLYYLLLREPTQLTRSLMPLGRHMQSIGDAVEVYAEAPGGVFYGYANDWWLYYDNNSGSVTLAIERLADDAPLPPVRYVVAASGIVKDGSGRDVGL